MSVTKLTITKRGAWLAENPQKHITLILLTVPKGISARDRGGDGRVHQSSGGCGSSCGHQLPATGAKMTNPPWGDGELETQGTLSLEPHPRLQRNPLLNVSVLWQSTEVSWSHCGTFWHGQKAFLTSTKETVQEELFAKKRKKNLMPER